MVPYINLFLSVQSFWSGYVYLILIIHSKYFMLVPREKIRRKAKSFHHNHKGVTRLFGRSYVSRVWGWDIDSSNKLASHWTEKCGTSAQL